MALSRNRKILIGVVVAVVLVMITAISLFATRRDVPEVTTVKIEKRPQLKSTVTASGEVRPIQYINLTSEVQGRIVEIYVKEGDTVTKGQQLVKLDPTQLESSKDAQVAAVDQARDEIRVSQSQVATAQNQLAQAQQGLNASQAAVDTAQNQVATAQNQVATARQQVVTAQTDVDRAQVDLNVANRELKRNTELLESGVISRLEYDQAKDRIDTAAVALNNAKARLNAQKLAINEAQTRVIEAQSRVKEARSRVNQQAETVRGGQRSVATANLNVNSSVSRAQQQTALLRGSTSQRDKTLQVAPLNGIVAEIPSKVGTFATAGLSTTPLMTIADMSTVNLEVKVDETEIDKVAVGQPVKVKVDAFGDRELEGAVKQKTPLAVGKSQTSGGLSTNINVQEAKEFRVVIQLKNLSQDVQEGLRPGMSATATITTNTATDVVAIPLQALIDKQPDNADSSANANTAVANNGPKPVGDKPKSIKGVYILDTNKVKFAQVTTGITGESDIQILTGLEPGTEIITGPSRVLKTLKEGDTVKKQTRGDNANK